MITLENNITKSLKSGRIRHITRYSGVKNPTEKLEVMGVTSPTPYIGPYKGWKLIEKRMVGGIEGHKVPQWIALFYRMVGKPTIRQWIKYYFKRLIDFVK